MVALGGLEITASFGRKLMVLEKRPTFRGELAVSFRECNM